MKELVPGIMVFDNVFIDSINYLKKIEQEKIPWVPAKVLVNQDKKESGTNYSVRDTDMILLPHHLNPEQGVLENFSKDFNRSIKFCLDEYVNFYSAKFERYENPQLLKYGKEQRFHNHIDDHPLFPRRISLTYYLNDDYEGGDVEFNRFNIKFKAKKNQLLVFPSNFVYNHEVHPVTSGLRYVIVQWVA